MKIVLGLLCILGQYLYVRSTFKKNYSFGLICKSVASVCFLLLGVIGYKTYSINFNLYLLIGFIFDMIGDVLLGLRRLLLHDVMFFVGTIAFMVGHIFYVLALNSVINKGFMLCLLIGIAIGVALYIHFVSNCKIPNAFKKIGVIYTSLLSIILVLSIRHYIENPIGCNLLFMIGSIFFSISDYVLIYNSFGKKKWWMHPLYSSMYYIGQLIIAYSMFN